MKGITRSAIERAQSVLAEHNIGNTPLTSLQHLVQHKHVQVLGKREDQNEIGSYKIRGSLYALACLSPEKRKSGVVCASAGNHAQGVAYACKLLETQGVIFMPRTTDPMKIRRVREFGGKWVEIRLEGDYFDQAQRAAKQYQTQNKSIFIHPFDDRNVILGQSTVTAEILQANPEVQALVYPVGGGGLIAGGILARDALGSSARIIGAEPQGAPSMTHALQQGTNDALDHVDSFVGGAAVAKVGKNTFEVVRRNKTEIVLVPEGLVAEKMIAFHHAGQVVEPAGALGLAGIQMTVDQLRGTVATVVSGRCISPEMWPVALARAEKYSGRRMVLDVVFPEREGALAALMGLLPRGINISGFQYHKSTDPMSPARIEFEGEPQTLKQLPNLIQKAGFTYSEAE